MTVKIYCDICDALIPEASEGEGEDAGSLSFGWGVWGEKPLNFFFDFDALCKDCTEKIKNALDFCISEIIGKEIVGEEVSS